MNKERCFARSITYPEISDWLRNGASLKHSISTDEIFFKSNNDQNIVSLSLAPLGKSFSYIYYFCCYLPCND